MNQETPKRPPVDEDGTPRRYWRMKLLISGVSVLVGLTVAITRLPRFFIELEEWSGIQVHEHLGIEKPPPKPSDAPAAAPQPAAAVRALPVSTAPAPAAGAKAPEPRPTESAPPPPPTPNRDTTFTYAITAGGKKHVYWYGPPDADRATRVRTKLVGTGLWSELRTQAFTIDAVLDAETKLLVSKAMDENADGHLTLSELTAARRRGLMGLLQGH